MADYIVLDGSKVKEARENMGKTQQQIAAELGAKTKSVINWERPRQVRIQGRFGRRLMKFLGMEG